MEIVVHRKWFSPTATISEVEVDGAAVCFMLEDCVRQVDGRPVAEWKVPGETAIPTGRYRVTITPSARFGRNLPLLDGVEGFAGIRIHPGNGPQDTEGCLLPGHKVIGPNTVGQSKLAFEGLYALIAEELRAGGEVWITVANDPTTDPLPCS